MLVPARYLSAFGRVWFVKSSGLHVSRPRWRSYDLLTDPDVTTTPETDRQRRARTITNQRRTIASLVRQHPPCRGKCNQD